MATVNVAEHFGLDSIIGGIAPGRCADMVLLPALDRIEPEIVVSDGRVIAEKGTLLVEPRVHIYSDASCNTVRLPEPVTAHRFAIGASGKEGSVKVRVIDMVTDLVTREVHLEVPTSEGEIAADPAADLLKVAAVDRRFSPGKTFTGLIRGFGLQQGAFAASSAWDTADIIAVGASDEDIAAAVNRIADLQGGVVLCVDGQVTEEIPLPVFGIVSALPMAELARRLEAVNRAVSALGCSFPDPLLSLVTLTGAAIPFIRICEEGLVDFKTGKTVGIFVDENAHRF
jgi:adenine deaminase